MPYSLKKFARELAIAVIGVTAFAVASLPAEFLPSIGVSEAMAASVPVIAMLVYRQIREHNTTLRTIDPRGE